MNRITPPPAVRRHYFSWQSPPLMARQDVSSDAKLLGNWILDRSRRDVTKSAVPMNVEHVSAELGLEIPRISSALSDLQSIGYLSATATDVTHGQITVWIAPEFQPRAVRS